MSNEQLATEDDIANCKLQIENCKLEERWVRARVVAEVLQISEVQVHRYGASGRIRRKVVREGSGFKKAYYSLEDVFRFEGMKDAWKRTISVEQWNHDLRHPYVRTKIVAPEGYRLISRR